MEMSALTRSVVKRNHAIIAPDGYINSNVPGWTGCTVNVIINEQMGARLCQTLDYAHRRRPAGRAKPQASQIFFYVVQGELPGRRRRRNPDSESGPVRVRARGSELRLRQPDAGTQLLTFHKVYEPLAGHATPGMFWGERDCSKAPVYMNDEALRIQELLPNELGFDMAVNIFTYGIGGNLPMVETHIMEHGLMYLEGQAIYMLDQCWYPVKKGDSIWMAPYCQQWATAMGQEPSVYIYYKNVNRFPTVR